jgi:hypothetical protein
VGPVGNTGPLAKLVALRILDRLAQVSLGGAVAPPETGLDAGVPGVPAVLDRPLAELPAELPVPFAAELPPF